MTYSELSEEQKEQRREAVTKYREKRRGRPKTRTPEQKLKQQRRANMVAYYKKLGKTPPRQAIANQFGPTDMISGKSLEYYRQKHAAYEGTRLEKSIIKPIFLTESMRKQKGET